MNRSSQVEFIPGVKIWWTIRKSFTIINHNDISKKKSYISIDAENSDKISHLFLIKKMTKLKKKLAIS